VRSDERKPRSQQPEREKVSLQSEKRDSRKENPLFDAKKILESVNQHLENARIEFDSFHHHEGDFTICVLRIKTAETDETVAASARRAHGDVFDKETGERIAFHRALDLAFNTPSLYADTTRLRAKRHQCQQDKKPQLPSVKCVQEAIAEHVATFLNENKHLGAVLEKEKLCVDITVERHADHS
jgi:hypothetical protein